MQYNPPYGAQPNSPYVNGNPAAGIEGSIPPAAAIEYTQREIVNTILAASLAPTNSDLTQLTQAIELLSRIPYIIDVGAANAVRIQPVIQATAYLPPMIYLIKWGFANTGATTISVSGLPPLPLLRPTGQALQPGDIGPPGAGIVYTPDGVTFQLLSAAESVGNAPVIIHYGKDASIVVNSIVATVDPTVTSYSTPLWFGILPANTNSSGTVLANINGIGAIYITRGAGNPLAAGDIVAGTMAFMFCDGSELQLLNPQQLNAGTGGGGGGGGGSGYPPDWDDITGQLAPYWLTVKSATVSTQPGLPTSGDVYIIPSGASGTWSSLGGKVGQYIGSAGWVYRTYPAGSLLSVTDTMTFYEFDGSSWRPRVVPSPGYLHHFANC
jgi:Protein of unknown function (DUF2793)